jgi:hypothetical protein
LIVAEVCALLMVMMTLLRSLLLARYPQRATPKMLQVVVSVQKIQVALGACQKISVWMISRKPARVWQIILVATNSLQCREIKNAQMRAIPVY